MTPTMAARMRAGVLLGVLRMVATASRAMNHRCCWSEKTMIIIDC
jgi:hypothetical protein